MLNEISLREISYSGGFRENSFHGKGTLFLNNNQKIVTQFRNGVPYGNLTYYCLEKV